MTRALAILFLLCAAGCATTRPEFTPEQRRAYYTLDSLTKRPDEER